jgi:hypothetical protein
MSNFFNRLLGNLFGSGKDWWLEIKTSQPNCTYYFGPFESETEAESLKGGYIEDLEAEGAQNIQFSLMQCVTPGEPLTRSEDADSLFNSFSPAFSANS